MFQDYQVTTGTTMQELARAEEKKAKATTITETTLRTLSVDVDQTNSLRLSYEAGGTYNTDQMYYEGFDYLCYRLGIPVSYLRRCPTNLIEPHVNYWLEEKPDRSVRVFSISGNVVAVVTDRYAYIPNEKLLENIDQLPNLKVVRWSHSPRVMTAFVEADSRTPETVQSIQQGDEVWLGMTISNSDTGWGQLSCEGTLGLSQGGWLIIPTRKGGFKKRHQGDPDNLWSEFSDVWTKLTANFKDVAKRLKKMAKEVVTVLEAEGIVDQIVDLLGLPKKAKEDLQPTIDTTSLGVLERLLQLADDPGYASYEEKIRRAAGEWVVTDDPSSPLWVTI